LRLVRYALWASRVGFMAVMEKPRGGGGGFQYKFLGTSRVATVETEMNEAARQGYVLVKLVSSEPPQAIMERRVGSATPGAGATEGQTFPEEGKQYLVLSTTKQTTIEKEVEQATANGSYVVADITGAVANHKVVLEKVSPGVARQYRSFGVKRLAKWQEQMNEAAAQGFRPFPGRAWSLWVKDSADTGQPSEFLLLDACRASSLRNEILDAVGRGYGPVEGELWVLQKPAAERVQSR